MADQNIFSITDADKEWVQENFRWLIAVYGYPDPSYPTILFTKEFFPETFSNKQVRIEDLISDLSNFFVLDVKKISFEITEDIRDTEEVPYEVQGRPFYTDLIIDQSSEENLYKIVVAKSLLQHPGQLLLNLDLEFVRIRLNEQKLEYDTGEDSDLFIYLAGVFLQQGVIIYQNLLSVVVTQGNFFWQKTWRYVSDLPSPVMAYALALYYDLIGENNPDWKRYFSIDFQKQYDQATEFIKKDSNPLFDRTELDSKRLFQQAYDKSDKGDFDGAIADYQKILFLTKNEIVKSSVYNNIGYGYLNKKDYDKSIPFFQKALELRPGFGYANDNLGFAFIMSGDLESGKYYLSIALQTLDNDAAYSYRNFALYHQKRKEYEQAEDYFQKAFNSIKIPVDLLEYFYARLLFEIGEKEKGMDYLKKAVDKGDPEAIRLMKEYLDGQNNTKTF